jgi:hypothetical protein
MFILNKKSGMITECSNADVIKTCKKDANYEVKENREDFETQEPQKEPEKVTPKETITEEKKTSPEEAEEPKEGENDGASQEGETEEEPKEDEQPEGDEEEQLRAKTVADLRVIAKEKGIQGYANMNKDTLVAMIMNH